MRQTAKHENIVPKLNQLLSINEVLITDKETIKQALNSPFKDFEDALQNFSAKMNGDIDVIVTRNIKDYKNSGLEVMTPKHYLKDNNCKPQTPHLECYYLATYTNPSTPLTGEILHYNISENIT